MDSVYEASDDSFLLVDVVKPFVSSSTTLLDMGAGSGYVGLELAKVGAKVTFADKNPESVKYISSFLESEDLPFTVLESDLFSSISSRFDIVVFNTPYLPDEQDVHDPALHGGPTGIEVAKKFISQVKDHLTDGGVVFLLTSSLADQPSLRRHMHEQGFQVSCVAKRSFFFEELLVYKCTLQQFDCEDQEHIALLQSLLPSSFSNPEFLARGKRGVVFKGVYDTKPAVCKVHKPGSDAKQALLLESEYLQKANDLGIGPRLYFADEQSVIMEYIPGVLIGDFLRSASSSEIRQVLKEIFSQLILLDSRQLNKFELTNPYKHIIITPDAKPVLLDFERMRFTHRPKNVTQFAQYLTSKNLLPILQEKGILSSVDSFTDEIKKYARGEPAVIHAQL